MSDLAAIKQAFAFDLLTGGVKFSGKKHRADIAMFRKGSATGGGESKVGGASGAFGGEAGDLRANSGASASGRGQAVTAGGGGGTRKKKKRKGGGGGAHDELPEVSLEDADGSNPIAIFAATIAGGGSGEEPASGGKGGVTKRKARAATSIEEAQGGRGRDFTSGAGEDNGAGTPRSAVEEAAAVLRKQHRIRVQGGGVSCPAPLESFADVRARFGAGRMLMQRLTEAGFSDPTPIQRQAVPILLGGHELLAVAPTGSGKTLAFLLPIVVKLRSRDDAAGGPRALLLSPTKELAQQSFRILKLLCRGTTLRHCLLTKATANNEMDKVDILVATPLRLKLLIEAKKCSLSAVLFLVLDEADKLFEMGFVEQVDAAVAACDGPHVTRALFSATLPETVEALARSVMVQPMRLTVGERNSASGTITQRLVFCGQERGKLLALRQLIDEGIKPPIIVFVQSKDRAKQLAKELVGDGLHLGLIHAAMSDAKRQAQVDRFRAGDTWVLIATDLMARGMDFVGVSTVVNYDFPGSPHSYIHRIGRSGRAGRPGAAVTLFTEEDAERGDLRAIANVMRNSGCEVPGWMLAAGSSDPRARRKKRKDGREDNPRREPIDTMRAANDAARAAKAAAARDKSKNKRKRSAATRDEATVRGTDGGGASAPSTKRARD